MPKVESITTEVFGEPQQLRFDFYAMSRLKQLTGQGLLMHVAAIRSNRADGSFDIDTDSFSALTWAALLCNERDPEYSLADVQRMLDYRVMVALFPDLEKAITLAFPETPADVPAEDAGKNPPARRPKKRTISTGARSAS